MKTILTAILVTVASAAFAAVSFKDPTAGQAVVFHDSNTLTNGTVASGGISTNENQFLGVPLSIKSGALVTNLNEFGTTTINDIVLTNQLTLVRVDLKSIVGNKTNLLDFNLGPMVVLTNNLATNSIFILTNTDVGKSMSVYLYGSGILGGTTTNAWQVTFQSQASGTNIVWPIGSTNGNYDVLVNSNQYLRVDFTIPRTTNIWGAYDIKQ